MIFFIKLPWENWRCVISWQDQSIPLLRTILSDGGCGNLSYTDTRLEELLLAAAYLNLTLVTFSIDYSIDIISDTISPDPSTSSPIDVTFINFMVLKAACLADEGLFRTKALSAGIKARCGPAILETMNHIEGFKILLEQGPCRAFEEMLNQYRFSGNADNIKAIMTPFVSNNFDPTMHRGGGGSFHRDRINI